MMELFSENSQQFLVVYIFAENLHHRCLTALNTPLTPVLSARSSQIKFLPLCLSMSDLLDLINLPIYIKLYQVNSNDTLNIT